MIVQKKTETIGSEDVEERGSLADRLLFWLLKHPYQRLSDASFGLQVHASTIWRHLQTLTEQGRVEAVLTATSKQALYYLNADGIEYLANLIGGADPAKLAWMWQANEGELLRLLPQLHSYIPLQEAVLRLIGDAPRQLAYPGGYPAAIRWHWQRDYVHAFERKKKHLTFRADGAVVFRRRPLRQGGQEDGAEAWYCFLFFVDPGLRGSEDLRLMRERLEKMLLWRESSERWSFYRAFPPLFILAPTAHQRDLWTHCAREAAAHLQVAPLRGACAMQEEDSPWRFLWHLLDGSGSVSLQSLADPLVPQAIPPGLLAPKQIEPGTFSRRGEKRASKIVTGNFAGRSKLQETSNSDPKTMADVALLSLRLSPRHIDVLQHIYALPLVARGELAALLQVEASTYRRYLYDLHHFHCLETIATNRGKRFVLTEAGLRLIASMMDVPLVHVAERTTSTQQWQQRGVPQVMRTIQHTAGIYTFLARLQHQASKVGQELLWWETTRSLRRYHLQGKWHNLMPDALFEYQARETQVEAWLEWDTGSMHHKPLLQKFEAYAQYIRSQQYRHEHRTPPTLLLVTPQNGREQSLRRIAASVLGSFPLTVRTTTEPLLKVQGPLAAIWKPGFVDTEDDGVRSVWIE